MIRVGDLSFLSFPFLHTFCAHPNNEHPKFSTIFNPLFLTYNPIIFLSFSYSSVLLIRRSKEALSWVPIWRRQIS